MARLAREKATNNLIENLLPKVTFTEPPGSSILCLLCKGILRNPMQLSCGHRFSYLFIYVSCFFPQSLVLF